MLKLLIILFLVGYIVLRMGGFILRLFFSGLSGQQRQGNFNTQSQSTYKKKAPGSNLNIDHVPGKKGGKRNFDGGEYVDYEEVQ